MLLRFIAAWFAIGLVSFPAHADSVSVSPLMQYLNPILTAALTTAAGIIVSQVIALLIKLLQRAGVQAKTEDFAIIQRSVTKGVGQLWAKEEAAIAAQKIDVNDQRLGPVINFVFNDVPDILTKWGITPDYIRQWVVAEIGEWQAKSPSAPATVPKA